MTPQKLLEEAAKTLDKRGASYGEYTKSLNDIAAYWRVYFKMRGYGAELTARDFAMLMVLLKVARTHGAPGHIDNYIDIAGYAALAGGLVSND